MASTTLPLIGINADPDSNQFLQGYKPFEWPDLSATRETIDDIHTTSHQLLHLQSDKEYSSLILTAVARILGTYCDTSDILLAVQFDDIGGATFIRITWNETDTWKDVVGVVDQLLLQGNGAHLSVEAIRRIFDMNDKQWPCVALCRFSSSTVVALSDYPLTFSYNLSDSSIHLSSSKTCTHPSVSSQILSQLSALTLHAKAQHNLPIASAPELPLELMSVYEKVVDEESLAKAYPHLASARFAFDYLTQRAILNPNSVAVRWYPNLSEETEFHDCESITYAALDKRANQVAWWLRGLGLENEDRVAVCMNRNLYFHIAMIGIMRAGGCYVPIESDLPSERKAYIARDSNARFVLTSTDISSRSLFGASTIFFDSGECQSAIQNQDEHHPDFASPEGLAFLLYTSGTTGTPKGCLLTHRALSHALRALSGTAADVKMDDLTQGRYLAVASVAFDVHIGETFVPFALGMVLLASPRSQLLENLPLYVKNFGVTHLGIVPSLIDATMGASQEEASGGTLRYIASGGEKMSDSILDKWANHPQVRLANFYGPSEVTIGCCARYMDFTTPKGNIGRPFANVSGYVVDSNLNILIRGGVGELVVEGPLVGRGYHGRPDLTEKVFLEWPKEGMWAYRTGDLVRMMPDTTLEILGRIDTQIKLRGVRIESEGISSIIRKVTSSGFSLDATTVLAKHPSIGTEQLVSFIAWDSSVPVSVRKSSTPALLPAPKGLLREIRHICDAEIARYMRPSHIIPLGWLPLSSNGKSDNKILVKIFNDISLENLAALMASDPDTAETRPATQLEQEIFSILGQHIAVMPTFAHPHINIFECGLDSMRVIQFASDLQKAFGRKISVSEIMSEPTLMGLSSILQTPPTIPTLRSLDSYVEKFSTNWLSEVQLNYPKDSIDYILPPFSLQEGVLSRSADHETMYVQHVIVECKRHTSLDRLRYAWERVIEMHPILRTVFYFSSALVQVVLRYNELSLHWDERKTESLDREEFSQWFLGNEALTTAKSINAAISMISPLRICVYTSSKTAFVVLSIHHALFDGISLPILMNDVERKYLDYTPQPTASSSEILNHIATIDLEKAQEFWSNYFRGFIWPADTLRSTLPTRSKRQINHFKATLSSVKDVATSRRVTLQALLTCTFASLASAKLYQRNDITFGVIRSGRLLPVNNIESAMSPMVSVVPMRVNFGISGDILQHIQSSISAVVDFEHIPLGRVQNWIRPGKPLFDVLFSVSVKDDSKSEIWDMFESEPPEADYVLSIEVVLDPAHNSLSVRAAWTEGDIDDKTIASFLDEFERIAFSVDAKHFKVMEQAFMVPISGFEGESIDEFEADVGTIDLKMTAELQSILSKFLGIKKDIITDFTSFISLGLDSIKSVGLSRAFKSQGYKVAAVDLMKYYTIQKLRNHLTSSGPLGVDVGNAVDDRTFFNESLATIRKSLPVDQIRFALDDQVIIFPTTTLQAGMLSQTINSGGVLYVHAFPLRLVHGVDVDRLERAWSRAVDMFSILRTSFHFIADLGIWAQAVHSSNRFDWIVDTFQSGEDCDRKILEYVSSIRPGEEKSFHQPPIWIRVFNPELDSPDQASRLVLVMHHALYDGVSIGKLLDAVKALYCGLDIGTPAQFTDLLGYFVQQEQKGASFFTKKLEGYHPVYLPRHNGIKESSTSHMVSHDVILDPVILENFLRRAAVTLQCLGQAVWTKLISQLCGSPDIVFGHIVSGRSMPGAEHVIGPVLNTIPCRVRLREGMRNIELLKLIHQSNVDSLPWQQASLRTIQKELGISRLWDSLFLFQPFTPQEVGLESLWELNTSEEEVNTQYAINIEIHQHNSGFTVKIASRTDCMSLHELESLAHQFQQLLETLISRPDALVSIDRLGPNVASNLNSDYLAYEPAEQVLDVANYKDSSIGPIQDLLASITKTPVDKITSNTPLVALGIDSITAIQITTHFRRAGMKLAVNDVITSRTVADMVAKIGFSDAAAVQSVTQSTEAQTGLSQEEIDAILIRLGDNSKFVENVIPTSSGMKWLIGAWQRSDRTQYQDVFAYRLPGEFDITKFQAAWTSLLQRLVLLRSTFVCAEGGTEPYLVVFKPGQFEYWVEEEVNDEKIASLALERMKQLLSSPPPTNIPPTRAVLLHSTQQCYFIIHLHHFQFDAWSLSLIMNDLSRSCLGLEPTSSNDINSFLNIASAPKHLDLQRQYWQTLFPQGFRPILLPALIPSANSTRQRQRTIYTTKEAIINAELCEERARSLRVSLQAVFLACWAQVQGKYSSSNFATFGLWQAGRTGLLDDIANLSVPCSNIVPMHIPQLQGTEIVDLASKIEDDLRARTAIIVQSDLLQIDKWVGGNKKPLYNVVVNIVKVAPDVTTQAAHLEQVETPYFVPDVAPAEASPTLDRLPITDLIQNDLIIDIATVPKGNSILMSLDAAAHMMDVDKAKEVVCQWACAVMDALQLS